MNLNHDPESWARVDPELVCAGSQAQRINILRMALEDIAKMAAEIERLRNKINLPLLRANILAKIIIGHSKRNEVHAIEALINARDTIWSEQASQN